MTSLEKSWEELNLSRDEVKNLGEALKNEDFRKLLVEYVEETQNPENRKKYQDDIVQLEAERGVDCTFVNPQPGFVVKTSDGAKKVFVNICSNALIGKPNPQRGAENGLTWSIPYSPGPGRDDYDKKNSRCIVYDVVLHPNTLQLAEKNLAFRGLVISTALDGIESAYGVNLDKRNYRLPRMKYKGVPQPTVVRKKTDKVVSEEDQQFHKDFPLPFKIPEKTAGKISSVENYTKPSYVIKHRSDINLQNFTYDKHCRINAAVPKELIVEVNLPLISNFDSLSLDVREKNFQLVSEKPAKYKLSLDLPYAVADSGSAKFIADKRILIVTLPVVQFNPKTELIREDSGVESDNGDLGAPPATPPPESFLDPSQHYQLPSYDCSKDESSVCFVLNVKNVDPASIKTKNLDRGFHLKFSSVGSGFFPFHYAFYADFDQRLAEDVSVEAWDNNVTVQARFDGLAGDFRVGLSETDKQQRAVDQIADLTAAVADMAIAENPIELVSVSEEELVFDVDFQREESPEDDEDVPAEPLPKMRTMSEGCADELRVSVHRGILKNRSLSESCADAFIWPDSLTSEPRSELKKTVRFSQHIQQQTFRINSSILGQRKKNQRKTRNKRRAQERRLSESENSEEGEEKWMRNPPATVDKTKKGKKSNFRTPLAKQLVK